jgi:hypothetical protein
MEGKSHIGRLQEIEKENDCNLNKKKKLFIRDVWRSEIKLKDRATKKEKKRVNK